jgi:gliding motility-associated-like protein
MYISSEQDQATGEVQFILSSLNTNPCSGDADTSLVSFSEPLSANAGNDITTCSNNLTVQLDGVVSGTTTGLWTSSGSGFFFPGEDVLNAQYFARPEDSLAGLITLYLTATNANCIPATDSLLLTIEAIPVADAGPDQTVCEGTPQVQLDGSVSNAPSGTWGTNGTGTFSPSPNVLNPVYIFSDEDQMLGNVILSLSTVQNGVCSNAIDLMEIDINSPLIADFSWTGQCEKSTIQFTDQTIINAGTIESFEWAFGDGIMSQVQNPAHIYGASGTYDVELIVYSNLGCSDSTTLQVQIFDNPQPGFAYEGTENNFEVQFVSQALGATLFEWEFGDGLGMSFEENPRYQYSEEGAYTVTQFVSNNAGCSDSLSQVVTVTSPDAVPPVTPDGFSPNGDGVNDIFYVRGGPFSKMNLKIYDGWGELIYETDDVEGGWDGTYKGQKVQMGIYIYIVDAIGVSGKIYKIQGNVTLIK